MNVTKPPSPFVSPSPRTKPPDMKTTLSHLMTLNENQKPLRHTNPLNNAETLVAFIPNCSHWKTFRKWCDKKDVGLSSIINHMGRGLISPEINEDQVASKYPNALNALVTKNNIDHKPPRMTPIQMAAIAQDAIISDKILFDVVGRHLSVSIHRDYVLALKREVFKLTKLAPTPVIEKAVLLKMKKKKRTQY